MSNDHNYTIRQVKSLEELREDKRIPGGALGFKSSLRVIALDSEERGKGSYKGWPEIWRSAKSFRLTRRARSPR